MNARSTPLACRRRCLSSSIVIGCALAVAGCASSSVSVEAHHTPAGAHPGGGACRPSPEARCQPAAVRRGSADASVDEACIRSNVEREIAKTAERGATPSGFLLVTVSGQEVYSRALGYANWAHRVPNTADTSFRIGSVTKPITALAIVLLALDGVLSFDAPMRRYFDDVPEGHGENTIHQLLLHTSTLSEYTTSPWFLRYGSRPVASDELLRFIWQLPSRQLPGFVFRYSNSNYVVLAALIEKVTGIPYAEYLRRRVLAPAGMCNTAVGDGGSDPRRALGYVQKGEGLAPASDIDLSVALGAGDIRSTPRDLVRLHQALMGATLLPDSEKWRLYQWTSSGYAYGWRVTERAGVRIYSHAGSVRGFWSEYVRVPSRDAVIVMYSNNESFELSDVRRAALRGVLEGCGE